MVKVTAPLHSLRATGVFAGNVQFSNWKGRQFAGKKRNPKQPRTAPQRAARIFMGGIAKVWKSLSQVQQASWLNHPAAARTSAYHAYLQENSKRYQLLPNTLDQIDDVHCAPTATWPATEDTTWSWMVDWILTGLSRSVDVQFTINTIKDNWLAIIHYSDEALDFIRYDNVAGMLLADAPGIYKIHIEDITPGNHALRILPVSHTGLCWEKAYYKTVTILP